MKTVLEQLDLLGEVVPVLRRELDALRPANVPDGPTHESRVAASPAEAGTELAAAVSQGPAAVSQHPAAAQGGPYACAPPFADLLRSHRS